MTIHHTIAVASSSGGQSLPVAAGIAVFALLCWLANRWSDKPAILENLHRQGASLQFIKRCRRLETWLQEDPGRFYNIRYRDRNGWEHAAVCMVHHGGVYYADDTVSGARAEAQETASPAVPFPVSMEERIATLENEHRRLKEDVAEALKELATLERKLERAARPVHAQ